ncbi:MAG: GDP-L-fucose synthase [Candidatus Lokiarchaeum sp. GC14_75]|nr:MAG: GDP-L-fucose synthase [Candidatus Lokiarchaeum sp. GC14_75]HEC40844.1 NAD-dependent epimerase/dehydratase family protein [bacterium]
MTEILNADKTCWNCPAAKLMGNVDFRACGQARDFKVESEGDGEIVIECRRRPELGYFEPNLTFEQCPEWVLNEHGYKLNNMKVMILGIDGYLGWALALKLGKLGFQVSGFDNYTRRNCVMEKGAHTIIPIERMTQRLIAARDVLGININFRKIDLLDAPKVREFLEEVKPEAIIHYGEIPSAPYSMADLEHAVRVQENNVLGTLKILWLMKDIVPESCLIKLGTMGEYGTPLTGRPIFEGLFPADAIIKWDGREWSLGGETTPRDPVSFYHVSKVQDTFNVLEACKYWWLRSYDVMQGVIYGVYTEELILDKKLRTRYDVDEWFGTVINRFVAQAVAGIPLTIYGTGEQIRGFIALSDAMQCMIKLIISPPEPGQYDVVNQVSGLYKISDLAEVVAKVGNQRFNLNVSIQRIENPRVEADSHPFEVVARKLPRFLGFSPKIKLAEEIERMFGVLLEEDIRNRLDLKKHTIFPVTTWQGEKRQMQELEKYQPGTKEPKGYKPIFDT